MKNTNFDKINIIFIIYNYKLVGSISKKLRNCDLHSTQFCTGYLGQSFNDPWWSTKSFFKKNDSYLAKSTSWALYDHGSLCLFIYFEKRPKMVNFHSSRGWQCNFHAYLLLSLEVLFQIQQTSKKYCFNFLLYLSLVTKSTREKKGKAKKTIF